MSDFREEMRYEYPLTPESIVVDVGAYLGVFSKEIARRYKCTVLAFEPVTTFREQIPEINGVLIFPVGIEGASAVRGFQNMKLGFAISNDGTGRYSSGPAMEIVQTVNLIEFLNALGVDDVALLKLNIEGMELEVLEDLIQRQQLTRFDNIQVQFHPVIPDAEARRNSIVKELFKTHEPTYCYPWVWENYRKR